MTPVHATTGIVVVRIVADAVVLGRGMSTDANVVGSVFAHNSSSGPLRHIRGYGWDLETDTHPVHGMTKLQVISNRR